MANVAFILADFSPDSQFIEPWQRAPDAGYQPTVVGLRHGRRRAKRRSRLGGIRVKGPGRRPELTASGKARPMRTSAPVS